MCAQFHTGQPLILLCSAEKVTGDECENVSAQCFSLWSWFQTAWLINHPWVTTGKTVIGFTIDFEVEITGDNPGREVFDTRDKGEADEPEKMDATGIENNASNSEISSFYPNPAEDVIYVNDAEKVWIYNINGQLMKFATNHPSEINVSNLTSSIYIIKMENENVIRNEKLYKK